MEDSCHQTFFVRAAEEDAETTLVHLRVIEVRDACANEATAQKRMDS